MTFSIDQTIAVAIQPFLELPQSALCLAESRGELFGSLGRDALPLYAKGEVNLSAFQGYK